MTVSFPPSAPRPAVSRGGRPSGRSGLVTAACGPTSIVATFSAAASLVRALRPRVLRRGRAGGPRCAVAVPGARLFGGLVVASALRRSGTRSLVPRSRRPCRTGLRLAISGSFRPPSGLPLPRRRARGCRVPGRPVGGGGGGGRRFTGHVGHERDPSGGRQRVDKGRQKQRWGPPKWPPSLKIVRRRPTLPRSHPRSTIGAEGLSFRVRNGTGRFPFAMAAETLWRCGQMTAPREPHSGRKQVVCGKSSAY